MQKPIYRITKITISIILFLGFFVSCSAPTKKIVTSGTVMPDISGMAVYDNERFVVVHDTKCQETGHRLSILTANPGGKPHLESVLTDWSAYPRRGNDLESICAIPGRMGEFLAAESGYYKPSSGAAIHGHIYQLRIFLDNRGQWECEVIQRIPFPDHLKQIEGIGCLPEGEKGYPVILAERGARGTQGIISGALHWDILQLVKPEKNQVFSSLGHVPFLSEDTGWCESADIRSCSDIFIDKAARLWISSTQDGGDEGPFRSIIYLVGKVLPGADKPISLDPNPRVAWKIEGFKVESISGVPRDFSKNTTCSMDMSIGTDDESFGGAWRALTLHPTFWIENLPEQNESEHDER